MTIPIPEPMLWDTTTPHLYELQASLLDGTDDRAEPLDVYSRVSACARSPHRRSGSCC